MKYLVWIIMVWQYIKLEVTVKGFNKCCISNATDETDGDMLWNDSEEGGNVRGEYEEDERTECEDRDSNTD